ncbi:hypothetical protein FHS43_006171 [Streptosporangium becharense]|uniref:Uncharacterized protein n=1 Tax=Streptosporangium becharense TaxID=1816182 RepID=A0A7W9MGX2_9ACTN|nr:phage head-tail connector protein [Streptosporangium becharense]MBB2914859.1 hypothetical protein [Streptosporangium becharense]MBB5820330.1 hypothetical protein [Streptosporangium becharense]
MTYAFGAPVRLTTEIRSGGQLVTPASVELTIRLPDGTTAGPLTPPADGVGLYHYDYVSSQAGRHIARWTTTGPAGATEEPFDVAPMWDAGIVSLAEAKKHLNITTSADDGELAEVIRAVTPVIERHAGAVTRQTYTEDHPDGYGLVLQHTPVLAVTAITGARPGVLDQAVDELADARATGVVRRLDGRWISGPVRVTYTAGRTSVSANVRLAALIIIAHLWETQRGTVAPRLGSDDEVWDPRAGFAVPRRALELLGEQVPGIA